MPGAVNRDSTWYVAGGPFLQIRIVPSFSIGAEVSFRYFAGLHQDFAFSIGLTYHLKSKSRRMMEYIPTNPPLDLLKVSDIKFEPVFPVFFKYYDDNPIGTAVIENTGDKPIKNIQVSFYVKEYMENPKICTTIEELGPGESMEVVLYSLFTKNILEISESTKVSANIYVDSEYSGDKYRNESIKTLRLYDRNAISWVDDRRAAAFVTMKNPTVLKFSKFVSGQIKDKASKALNNNFLLSLAMLEALRLYDVSYVIDLSTPCSEFSQETMAVDYLQFPMQTLMYKVGDCDDLSILYCAFLESVGVETAFITVPGHIFVAVNLNVSPDEASRQFYRAEDLIFMEGKTWLPVEVTMLRGGFLTAWEQGAKQWREFSVLDQAGFFPIHDAWLIYEPVGFSSEAEDIEPPYSDTIAAEFLEEVMKFVDREIFFPCFPLRGKDSSLRGSP